MTEMNNLSDLFSEHYDCVKALSLEARRYGELIGNEKIDEAGRMAYSRLDWYGQYHGEADLEQPTKPGNKRKFGNLLRIFEFYARQADTVFRQLGVDDPFDWYIYKHYKKKINVEYAQITLHFEIQRVHRLQALVSEKLQELQNQ